VSIVVDYIMYCCNIRLGLRKTMKTSLRIIDALIEIRAGYTSPVL
jgi:hypothetical protein